MTHATPISPASASAQFVPAQSIDEVIARLDAIIEGIVQPDPQPVPEAVLERRGAVTPDTVLTASFWNVLRDLRERGVSRDEGLPALRAAVDRDLGL